MGAPAETTGYVKVGRDEQSCVLYLEHFYTIPKHIWCPVLNHRQSKPGIGFACACVCVCCVCVCVCGFGWYDTLHCLLPKYNVDS